LQQLYQLWNLAGGRQTPILFDAMPIAFIVDPQLCPVTSVHINVDDKGFTRIDAGPVNAYVCLHSDADAFFRFYMFRIVGSQLTASTQLKSH
jgi:hypothetical protein